MPVPSLKILGCQKSIPNLKASYWIFVTGYSLLLCLLMLPPVQHQVLTCFPMMFQISSKRNLMKKNEKASSSCLGHQNKSSVLQNTKISCLKYVNQLFPFLPFIVMFLLQSRSKKKRCLFLEESSSNCGSLTCAVLSSSKHYSLRTTTNLWPDNLRDVIGLQRAMHQPPSTFLQPGLPATICNHESII